MVGSGIETHLLFEAHVTNGGRARLTATVFEIALSIKRFAGDILPMMVLHPCSSTGFLGILGASFAEGHHLAKVGSQTCGSTGPKLAKIPVSFGSSANILTNLPKGAIAVHYDLRGRRFERSALLAGLSSRETLLSF